ncbi:MAG TPA: glycerol-3-phosphate dehydrogenase/oxidase [Streptosporangiaceae bacterium]|nr:glycerol-3-phosphate dehydrogenase/oxidase [Streptosporangiaceae bacterium]
MSGAIAGPGSASLNAARRSRELAEVAACGQADLLVVGGGVTGAGVALDAAARGLSVVLAERDDLASGTSRWSSKLVHGGLRYLARGEIGIAYESAAERGLIMGRIAPHLTRPLPMVYPWVPGTGRGSRALTGVGLAAADVLRLAAGTRRRTLPGPRRLTVAETMAAVPALRRDVTGGLLSWDGQLTDDARLVVAIARTAASHGAVILTRCAASDLTGRGALLTDRLTGESFPLRAGAVVNAAGVWAGQLAEGVSLRPSRGTHLVLSDAAFGGLRAGLIAAVPGQRNRYVFALPVPGEPRVYVGLTDEPVDGPMPDVPEPAPGEIAFLLDVVGGLLDARPGPGDVLGAFAGLRPLLGDAAATGSTADLSRRHAVLTSPDGVITVVGGKLTTYRRMAQDAVDAALAGRAAPSRTAPGRTASAPSRAASGRTGPARTARGRTAPCRTRRLPLVGAASPSVLARVPAPARLVARYGTEAPDVLALAGQDPWLAAPVADGLPVTGAELAFAVAHEGALDVGDLLDRRTRIGLVPGDRGRALAAATRVLDALPTRT